MLLLILLHIYFVTFRDKPEKTAPQLSERAWEQRAKWNIPTDGMDYPVSPMYMNQLTQLDVKIHHKSRWFNGVTCEMSEETAKKVAELKFVTGVEMTREDKSSNLKFNISYPKGTTISNLRFNNSSFNREYTAVGEEPEKEKWTDAQLELYNLKPLHEMGYEGQGILMTLCDGGFYNVQNMSCFRPKELELGHFDFTDDAGDFYGSSGAHGMECLSTISGIADGFYGAATKAQYYLMRSEEEVTESPKEMDNLVAALEKADSLGVNIFSVSLGYGWFDNDKWTLPKTALDGKSTRASQAATIAARKGILVCVAAGNEGNNEWHTISVPGDADSILTVGAVNTEGEIGSFSSYGPAADGRVKPDVCAVGWQATIITPSGTIVRGNGTSFATPLLAGMAATLWSALPDENAMQIRERILKSANRYDDPDPERYGYGIPDAWVAYTMDRTTEGESSIQNSVFSIQKVLRDGQLYLMYEGTMYDVLGRRML